MRQALIACLIGVSCALCLPCAAQPTAAAGANACGDLGCSEPSLARTPTYPQQIERNGDFSAEVTINQPCACVRQLGLLVAFTAAGAKSSREQTIKLEVPQGTSTQKLGLTHAELVKANIGPGRYTLTFGVYDEHGKLAGNALAGYPFVIGKSHEELAAEPKLPAMIGRDSELAVPFVFTNDGEVAGKVTALVVFTRPDETKGIEMYVPDLIVPTRGAKHIVRINAAKRRSLNIGAGAWLVTTTAFNGAEQRLASYPGHLLMIGKTLSIPVAPEVTTPIEQTQDLTVTVTFKNDGPVADLVTGLVIFSGPGAKKPIEYKVEGIGVDPGTSTYPIILSSTDRTNLGIRPGRWKVAATALDRAGKRLELRRAATLVINAEASAASP